MLITGTRTTISRTRTQIPTIRPTRGLSRNKNITEVTPRARPTILTKGIEAEKTSGNIICY